MDNDIFYRFGKSIHRYRWLIIILWLILFCSCLPLLPKIMDPFKSIGFTDPHSQSALANDELNKKLGYSYNRFIVMYTSNRISADSSLFHNEIRKSLLDLDRLQVKHHVIYPDTNNKQISKNKHAAYAVVLFHSNQEADDKVLQQFRSSVKKPPNLDMKIGGEPIFLEDTKHQTQLDLFHAEYIGGPVTVLTMLIVFESVVAASVPVILGAACAILILMTLFVLGHIFPLSVFTINIALLLGLCLSLDYALLIINRYREELKHGITHSEAIAVTLTTAGKSVFFSGLAVFVSLSALLLFPINILFSVGVGGLAAVSISVAMAIIILPAVLAILNSRINSLPIRIVNKFNSGEISIWRRIVTKIVHRPYLFFCLNIFILLLLSYPILHAKTGISDFRILPPSQQSRQVFDEFEKYFGESKLSPILVLVKTGEGDILTKNNISELYHFASRIKQNPAVDQIESIVNTEPRLTREQYETLYTQPEKNLPAEVKKLLQLTTHGNMSVITVFSKYNSHDTETINLIENLRKMNPGKHITVEVTGTTAATVDVMNSIDKTIVYAFIWIIVFTYLVLLIFLRSVILPLKAIITTILSLCASYGMLVFTIQEGYLHSLLHFEPQGMLDISLLIIIFCALFGVSMDYEVFLLTRIKEYYERTGDTVESIVSGIDRSCKIISSAAIIVIAICISFMTAEILIVKAFGLGIAVAVFVDAFIIRIVLVPATMKILNSWNWYLPKWLDRILPNIAFDPEHFEKKKQ